MPTDFLTILGEVFAGVFGPWLVMILIVLVGVVFFFAACASGSSEVDAPWQITLAVWIGFVVYVIVAVALMIFVTQFELFSWVPLKGTQ